MKPLYCAATEFVQPDGSIKPKMFYMHIPDNEGCLYAERMFRRSHQKSLMAGRMRIVAVSRVVGFHALDDNGDKAVA
jgi:acyl CoA:acetate/3-ketoacid CoA transferase alpha subunit